jgi:hypothetical protein
MSGVKAFFGVSENKEGEVQSGKLDISGSIGDLFGMTNIINEIPQASKINMEFQSSLSVIFNLL